MTRSTGLAAIGAALCLAGGLTVLPQTAAAQPYGGNYPPNVQQEAAAHPRMVEAIRNAQSAYEMLRESPGDFGGRKAQAMDDLRRAIHSMKGALFYRTHMDDAAIERFRF